MSELDKVTTRFGRAYSRNKAAKRWLEQSQKRLFEIFTSELKSRPRAQKTVQYEGVLKDVEAHVANYYPGWRVLEMTQTTPTACYAIIEEDPALMAFTHIDPNTGMSVGRTPVHASPHLDDVRLKAENPDLWERITEWPEPWYGLVAHTVKLLASSLWSQEVVTRRIDTILRERKVERVLIDFNRMDTADLAIVQEYIMPGKVTVRLVPPLRTD